MICITISIRLYANFSVYTNIARFIIPYCTYLLFRGNKQKVFLAINHKRGRGGGLKPPELRIEEKMGEKRPAKKPLVVWPLNKTLIFWCLPLCNMHALSAFNVKMTFIDLNFYLLQFKFNLPSICFCNDYRVKKKRTHKNTSIL